MDSQPMMDHIDDLADTGDRHGVTPAATAGLVLVGAAPESVLASSLPGLSEALQSASLEVVGSLDAARHRLDEDPAAKMLVVYADPVVELARRLEQESTGSGPEGPELAIAAWVEEVLAFYRRHRRRIALVNGHAALADPRGFAHQLQQRLAVRVNLPDPGPGDADPPTQPSALALAVAQAVAQADDGLLAALEASSLPLEQSVRVDASLLIEAWRAIPNRGDMAEIKGKARELAEENELLSLQLLQVQEELETCFLANTHSQAEQVHAENAKRLEAELQAVYASLSWKLTAPLRAAARPFMREETGC